MEVTETILDAPCKQLLHEIEAIVPVKFTEWGKSNYGSQLHKNSDGSPREAEVFLRQPLEMSKIAHELLHMKVDLAMGDNNCMFAISNQHYWYTQIVSYDSAAHILNVCQHVIFFPDYLDMGYAEEDSFEDKELDVKKKADLQELTKTGLKTNGQYDISKVARYIALVFTMDFYPNENRFKKELKALRKKDNPLYSIIHELRRSCTNVEIDAGNRDYLQEAYFNFATKLNEWLKKVPLVAKFT